MTTILHASHLPKPQFPHLYLEGWDQGSLWYPSLCLQGPGHSQEHLPASSTVWPLIMKQEELGWTLPKMALVTLPEASSEVHTLN